MLQFLSGIADLIISAFEFLNNIVNDIIYVILLLGSVVLNLPNYLIWLPGHVAGLLITLFGIVVIYKILGREG